MNREDLIAALPKVELHLHLEGALEPELAFALARRNGVALPYASAADMRSAYRFTDLQSFLDIYYASCSVLRCEQDFYDLTRAYLERAAADNVRHVEPFFDPQTHTSRGVAYDAVAGGITRALDDAHRELGITSRLIVCMLRHESAEDAMDTLAQALASPFAVHGIGLDSSEVGNPPSKFTEVFARARDAGLHAVAHAGEEGPPSYITDSLDLLHVERIDHGVRCLEDPDLVARLVREKTCLTVCPNSNVALRVVDRMEDHPLRRMLDAGLRVTINADDPAYFGGYIGDNFRGAADGLDLSRAMLGRLAANAIDGSFADAVRKAELRAKLDAAVSRA